jgi:ABC-2 type transport system ATP-binding protein
MGRTAVVRVRALVHAYGERVALDALDLDVAAGECVAVLGHNGSGKTTALRSIAGQLTPTSGSVRVVGADPYHEPDAARARAAVGFVPDSPVFYRDLTIREHVELVALTHGARDGWEGLADALLEALGMADRADAFADTLSSGQRQRAQLACVLVRPLKVLLLDEPVLRLDPAGQRMLRAELERMLGEGVAVVVATHQPGFMVGLADRGLLLEDGRVAVAGDYGEVLASDAAVRLGVDAAGLGVDASPDVP